MKNLLCILLLLYGAAAYAEETSPDIRRPGGFADSWVRIAGFFSFGDPSGGLFSKDRRVFNAYKPDLLRACVLPRKYRQAGISMGGGGELDIMPPPVRYATRRSFDFTGVKFGIRCRYGYEFTDTIVTSEGAYFNRVQGYELLRARSMEYHYWAAGPVMNLMFGPRNDSFNLIINLYALAGQLPDGTFRGAAALRSSRWLAAELAGLYGPPGPLMKNIHLLAACYSNRTRFSGYTLRFGLGPHVSMNGRFPFILGINVAYSLSRIRTRTPLLIYCDMDRRASHGEIGAEISGGVHIP